MINDTKVLFIKSQFLFKLTCKFQFKNYFQCYFKRKTIWFIMKNCLEQIFIICIRITPTFDNVKSDIHVKIYSKWIQKGRDLLFKQNSLLKKSPQGVKKSGCRSQKMWGVIQNTHNFVWVFSFSNKRGDFEKVTDILFVQW